MKQPRPLESLILTLRGQKVILDADLARLYGVATGRLNEQVKRNADRFPEDFLFRLTAQEWGDLKSQVVTPSPGAPAQSPELQESLRSQTATLKGGRGQHRKYLPFAFTEHGALMAANLLNSPEAVKVSVFVIRAFVKMREQIAANSAILKRLAEIDRTLLTHDTALRDIYRKLVPLLSPPPDPPRRRIGFDPEK